MTSTPQIGLTRPDFIDLVAAEHDGGLPDREVREIAGQMWRLIQTGSSYLRWVEGESAADEEHP